MVSTASLTGVSTNGDAQVALLPPRENPPSPETLTVVNESGVKVFLSLDGGKSWFPMPAGTGPQTLKVGPLNRPLFEGVLAKRVPSGTDATGLYAYTF